MTEGAGSKSAGFNAEMPAIAEISDVSSPQAPPARVKIRRRIRHKRRLPRKTNVLFNVTMVFFGLLAIVGIIVVIHWLFSNVFLPSAGLPGN
jgi:hypothetical protein